MRVETISSIIIIILYYTRDSKPTYKTFVMAKMERSFALLHLMIFMDNTLTTLTLALNGLVNVAVSDICLLTFFLLGR